MSTVVVPGTTYQTSLEKRQRVDIRLCSPGVADGIQLAAWASGKEQPSLVIGTPGGDVVQLVMRTNILVIEISGGSSDHIYVISYEAGKPKLVLKQATKSRAIISSHDKALEIQIPNHWTKAVDRYTFKAN